jgi:hypothetical protein
MSGESTAAAFLKKLNTLRSAVELKKIQRYFKTGDGEYGNGDNDKKRRAHYLGLKNAD